MAEATGGDGSPGKVNNAPRVPNHRVMDRPMFRSDFIKTKEFLRAENKMKQENLNAMVFTGPTGAGKTSMATELCASIWRHDVNPSEVTTIFRELSCTSLESFYGHLTLFYQDLEITQKKLEPNYAKGWNILEPMFNDLNTVFPDYTKIIILDDAEELKGILDILDHLCKVINRNANIQGRWKFLVTSQKRVSYSKEFEGIGGENFFEVDGFAKEDIRRLFRSTTLDIVIIDEIVAVLGSRPLTLNIFKSSLRSNQVDDEAEIVRNLLRDIKIQAEALVESGRERRMDSALIAIKISIERLVKELPFPEVSIKLIKTLPMFNEKNLTMELLVSCAETYMDNPTQAKEIIKNLMNRLMERGHCTKQLEGKVPLFSLHRLVKQAFQLFSNDNHLDLVKHALLAITRVMPHDGRRHQTHVVRFYGDHGSTLDSVIRSMKLRINVADTPLILLLHCSMLIGMGYCQLAQRTDEYTQGVDRFKEARNKYCELVKNDSYEALIALDQEAGDGLQQERNLVRGLYAASQNLPFTTSEAYKQYITDLPLYRRLTEKDLANMEVDSQSFELVNGHLTRHQLETLRRENKVLPVDVFAKVYLPELLAEIYSVWSILPRRKTGQVDVKEYLVLAETAIEIYSMIFHQTEVYLLPSLITERQMLIMRLKAADNERDVNDIRGRLEILSKVGLKRKKRMAYEAGLLRSNIKNDTYHTLLCMQSAINSLGRLYEFSDNEILYDRGREMFREVLGLAEEQVYKHSALCFSYKNFASFLFSCKKSREAVIHLLTAMLELHKSLTNGNGTGNADPNNPHPEFTHPRFKELYSSLVPYYDKFYQERERLMEERGDEEVRSEERLLSVDTAECEYLLDAVIFLRNTSTGASNSAVGSVQQPEESNNSFQYLENIAEEDIQDLPMAVSNVAVSQ
ncbi:uncharacterized protein [Watersipora subatra]|uniref:uncharacterized protein n=1 Tax=Watersipora subatra TaxID=2589382 RepID=UPI00355BD389